MPLIKKEFTEKIVERSRRDSDDLVSIISQFSEQPRKEGASYKAACPLCHSEHSLVITPGKRLFKCFGCNNLDGKSPIDYLMKGQKMSFLEAIEWLASYYNCPVEYDEPKPKERPSAKSVKKSFCKRMLEESGLSYSDLTANVIEDGGTKAKKCTFLAGTVDKGGEIDLTGDDAVILYYDLEGKPVKYYTEDKGKITEHTYL